MLAKVMYTLGYIALVGNGLLVPINLLVGSYFLAAVAAAQAWALWYMLRD